MTRPTITALARHVGVSPATVSRVMNGNPTVAPDLAQRVKAAATQLGYRPSQSARALVLGRTSTVAVLVPDLTNPVFQGILRGISRAGAAHGVHMLVVDSAEDASAEPELAARARDRCDGIILVSPRAPDADLAAMLPALAPAVVLNRSSAALNAPVLTVDYRSGIAALAHHLADLGHRHLLYLAGSPGSYSDDERRAGLAEVAAQRGLAVQPHPCGVSAADGAAAAGAVLGSGATAVVAYNDLVAIGLADRLRTLGAHVPDRVSLTGFDGIDMGAFTTPRLTTAALPMAQIGAEAWARMSRLLAGEEITGDLVIRPELVARESTRPASGSPGGTDG